MVIAPAEAAIRREIETAGAICFSRFIELALYEPGVGFYQVQGQAGRGKGDFITSVEVGPLFAALVGDWLDMCWVRLGRPDPFLVVEAGAGVATLYRGVHHSEPACFVALHWTLVERSRAMRDQHGELPGGRWESLEDLPTEPVHVVLANELLDNLMFDIAERVGDGWAPLKVGLVDDRVDFLACSGLDPGLNWLDELAPNAPVGARVPVAIGAQDWLERALAIASTVLLVDYGALTAELAERGIDGWLRTFRVHQRAGNPLVDIGASDITHDVPFDQLVPPPDRQVEQREWLAGLGLNQRLETARQIWTERGPVGDLDALRARSALVEAEALTETSGLGGFTVLEWNR